MDTDKTKKQMRIVYGVAAAAICLTLTLTAGMLVGCDGEVDTTTEPTTVSTTETTETTTAMTTTALAETSDTSYAPATVPPASETEESTAETLLRPLDAELTAYLEGIGNDSRGWGPGSETDDLNRPIYAVTAQRNYGSKYGSSYLMNDKNVYLTFDEGYEYGYTERILDVLKEKDVKAVFFITLPYAKSEPALVQRMIDEGHIVGNHSTKHLEFPTMTIEEAYDDIKTLHEYVYTHFGYEMTLFRFPQGTSSDRMQALLQELGYTSVFWSFAHRDWLTDDQPGLVEAYADITDSVHPGAIYLLHAVSKTNAEILGNVIDAFRKEGYTIALYPTE